MQAFISGLLLACISAVTVLAFRHPRVYERLFPFAITAITVVFLMLSVWHVAIQVTWSALVSSLDRDFIVTAQASVSRLYLPYLWVGSGYLGVVIFLWINRKLPPFVQDTEKGLDKRKKVSATHTQKKQ